MRGEYTARTLEIVILSGAAPLCASESKDLMFARSRTLLGAHSRSLHSASAHAQKARVKKKRTLRSG